MNYRFFNSGERISEIGYGCWGIGKSWWGPTDDGESKRALQVAVELGVNFFDTALVYGQGHSEQLVGGVIRRNPGKEVRVASKIPPKNFQWPARPGTRLAEAFPRDHIRSSTEKTLKNLRLESIFLQQLHVFAPNWVNEPEWMEEMAKLRQEGKIQHWGVSVNDHQADTVVELVEREMVQSVQVIYNIFDQSAADRLLPACLRHGVSVIVRVPLDEGSLTGAFTETTEFAEPDFRSKYFRRERMMEVIRRVSALKKDLPEDVPICDAALRFVLQSDAVTTVIPGMRKIENVRKNLSVSGRPRLTNELEESLKTHRWIRNFYE